METKIRTIPADQDPRQATALESSPAQGPPPPLSGPQFPSLCERVTAPRNGDPKPTSPAYTYSHVLLYGINRPSILVKLPLEIREMIWEAYMRAHGIFMIYRIYIRDSVRMTDDPVRPRFLPPLRTISNSTWDKIIGVFMRNSPTMITSIHDNVYFRKLIAGIENGPAHVRELHFEYFGFFPNYTKDGERIPVNSDLELAVDCKGLQTLRLNFPDSQLTALGQSDDQDARSVGVQVLLASAPGL